MLPSRESAISGRHLRAPALVLLLACLGLAGCGFEPFQPPVSGDAPGPGLFSGPAGAFVITPPAAQPPAPSQKPSSSDADQGAGAPG